MLSALVLMPPFGGYGPDRPTGLVRSLAALVSATIEGLIRDVAVIDAGSDPGTRVIADDAGCRFVQAAAFGTAFKLAVDGARADILFVLRSGAFFDRALTDELAQRLAAPWHDARALLLRETPVGFLSRVLPDRAPVVGLITERGNLGATVSFDGLVRLLRSPETLKARARRLPG